MYNVSISTLTRPNLEEILEPGERLLWTGKPSYGGRFFQATGQERVFHFSFLVGGVVIWSLFPFIDENARLGRDQALWIFGVTTLLFMLYSGIIAGQREHVLRNLVYFVTNKRSIVCRRGMNFRLSTRLYVISFAHSPTFPYNVIATRPYPSLQIGLLLSKDAVQPFGLGLSHPGQPLHWGRITVPVVFEQLPDAHDLLEKILASTRADVRSSEED